MKWGCRVIRKNEKGLIYFSNTGIVRFGHQNELRQKMVALSLTVRVLVLPAGVADRVFSSPWPVLPRVVHASSI